MRVLFLPAPAVGHVFPMAPLAWAFRDAGHEVVFVTGGDGLRIADAGLPVLDALPGRTTTEMLLGFVQTAPELFTPVTGDPVEEMNRRKPYVVSAWGPYAEAHLALADLARPDLIVYDPIFGVGAFAAARLGVPAVAFGFTMSRYDPRLLTHPAVVAAFGQHGAPRTSDIPTIDLAPPSLAEGPPSGLQMRYVPYNGGAVLPNWLFEPPPRPRIAVTFGSLDRTQSFGYVDRILSAAPHVDAEFVITLADQQIPPADLPPNVRVTGWLPMNALLRTCVAAVHHGGGTSMTCCALGVPQLTVPEGAPDTLAEAEFLRARGAAHVLKAGDLGPEAIRALLADDKLRRVAGDLRAEMAAMPSPAELVTQLASPR